MSKKTKTISLGCIVLSFLLSVGVGCKEEMDDILDGSDTFSVKTSVGIPLAKVKFTMEDILRHRASKGMIEIDEVVYDISDFDINSELPELVNVKFDSDAIDASDAIDVDDLDDVFGEGGTIEKINELDLYVEVFNELPLDGDIELHFMSEVDDPVLGTITTEQTSLRRSVSIKMAQKDAQGKFVSGVTTKTSLNMGKDAAETLSKVTSIEMYYRFLTDQEIKYDIDYKQVVTVKMNVFVDGKVVIE